MVSLLSSFSSHACPADDLCGMTWTKCPQCQWQCRSGDSRNACGCSRVCLTPPSLDQLHRKNLQLPSIVCPHAKKERISGRWPRLRWPTLSMSNQKRCVLCVTAQVLQTRVKDHLMCMWIFPGGSLRPRSWAVAASGCALTGLGLVRAALPASHPVGDFCCTSPCNKPVRCVHGRHGNSGQLSVDTSCFTVFWPTQD